MTAPVASGRSVNAGRTAPGCSLSSLVSQSRSFHLDRPAANHRSAMSVGPLCGSSLRVSCWSFCGSPQVGSPARHKTASLDRSRYCATSVGGAWASRRRSPTATQAETLRLQRSGRSRLFGSAYRVMQKIPIEQAKESHGSVHHSCGEVAIDAGLLMRRADSTTIRSVDSKPTSQPRLRKRSRGVRLVSVLGIGAVLAALALYVDKQLRPVNPSWFAFAPNTSAAYYPPRGDSHVVARVFVWCNAGALWLIVAFSLLGRDERRAGSGATGDHASQA